MPPQPTQSADLQTSGESRAANRADLARVLLALGLLALLASFDGANSQNSPPETPPITDLDVSR